ncbi:hypothetical protein H5410_009661 [Solanum commersonii]|uniref:Uncharacterized protein n=1 Tax=Solanum commersonii TaxID=4109 RepID=A0A9J6AJD8_SOLCO|nr:hypothetical protein H5410_009661 [Solanum commersonii]
MRLTSFYTTVDITGAVQDYLEHYYLSTKPRYPKTLEHKVCPKLTCFTVTSCKSHKPQRQQPLLQPHLQLQEPSVHPLYQLPSHIVPFGPYSRSG